MIYKAGTVQVTRGSTTVTGNGTEFLRYVSSFSMFRRTGDTSTYIVDRVISQTELLLSTPYQGVSYEDTRYSINPDRTTNLGLPLLSPSLPDPSFVVNQALEKIDKNAGTFLDFNSLSEVTYSGETGFYIRGDYHSDELKLGRVLKLIDGSGEVISYDYVSNNSFFDADTLITPLAQDVYYSGETGAEEQLVAWDVLSNQNTAGYVFVKTIDTDTNHIVVSGEKIGSAWSADDALHCYGHTMGLGEIDTGLTTTAVPLTNVSGESLNLTEFKTNDLMYNYQRNSSRSITAGGVASLTTVTTTDDWAVGDTVYTVKADIKVATPNTGSNVASVEYGAQSQIGTDSVKKASVDFGFGSQQVWAEDIPVSASPLSATDVNTAITELNSDFINHTTTGEAHLGNDVHFADDGQGAHVLTSTHMQDSVNELKNRINVSDFVTGAVDYSEDVEQFYAYSFINYPNAFMNSGERWCRMETGTNAGYVRKIDSFENGSGEFNFASGEGFTYVPSEGDVFSVILTSELVTPALHNSLTSIDGGSTAEYYHMTSGEHATLTTNEMADTLHRHSELSASDGDPDQAVSVNEDGTTTIGTSCVINNLQGKITINSDEATKFILGRTGALAGEWKEAITHGYGGGLGSLVFYPELDTSDFLILDYDDNPRFYLDTSTGYVGLGTTSPAVDLQLGDNEDADRLLRLNSDTAGSYVQLHSSGTWGSLYKYGTGPLVVGTVDAQPLQLNTSNTARINITSTGNVGIGTTTPSVDLEIGEDGDEDRFLRLNSDTVGSYLQLNSLGNQSQLYSYGDIPMFIGNVGNEAVSIITNGVGRIKIDKDGNVGVGVTPTSNMAGLAIEAGTLTIKETTTPTADADYGKVYCKSDNKLYFQSGDGVEHEISLAT